jgi:hypothetical protein
MYVVSRLRVKKLCITLKSILFKIHAIIFLYYTHARDVFSATYGLKSLHKYLVNFSLQTVEDLH